MSPEAFSNAYIKPSRPAIIRGGAATWPALSTWYFRHLEAALPGSTLHVGGYEFGIRQYETYCRNSRDEMPLMVFDKGFAEKAPSLVKDFHAP